MKEIKLNNGYVTIVDDEDYEKFSCYNYVKTFKGYVSRRCTTPTGRKTILLHREIMNAPQGMVVDHINHDKLDNRKSNLRLVTNQQNRFNSNKPNSAKTSKYKGVSWRKYVQLWIASIRFNGKDEIIGRFKSEDTAAVAYNVYAKKYFGEYALLNDVPFDPDWESKKILDRRSGSGKSKYIGLTYIQKRNVWNVYITVERKRIYVGTFEDEIAAAKAYNEAAIKYRGEKAKLNKIDERSS